MNIIELANKLETQIKTENNRFCSYFDFMDCQYFIKLNNRNPKIHGMMVILGCYARNPNESDDLIQNRAVILATAIEFYLTTLIMNSSIVHHKRRNQQVYSINEQQYYAEEESQNIEKLIFILKTKGLLHALKLLIDHNYEDDIGKFFYKIIKYTLHGEALDILAPICNISDEYKYIVEKDLESREIKRKIESFLFETSFYMGYCLGGGNIDESVIQWFKEFGSNLASICQLKVRVNLLQNEYSLDDLYIYQRSNNINSFNELLKSIDDGPLSNGADIIKEYLCTNILDIFLKNG